MEPSYLNKLYKRYNVVFFEDKVKVVEGKPGKYYPNYSFEKDTITQEPSLTIWEYIKSKYTFFKLFCTVKAWHLTRKGEVLSKILCHYPIPFIQIGDHILYIFKGRIWSNRQYNCQFAEILKDPDWKDIEWNVKDYHQLQQQTFKFTSPKAAELKKALDQHGMEFSRPSIKIYGRFWTWVVLKVLGYKIKSHSKIDNSFYR